MLGVHDPAFTDGTAQQFLRTFRYTGAKSTYVPQPAIITVSRAARGVEAALETVGMGSAHLRFFGKPPPIRRATAISARPRSAPATTSLRSPPRRPPTRWRRSAIRA